MSDFQWWTMACVLGTLVEVYEGQAIKVQPFGEGREPYDLFVMDPEPYRGHEGKALIFDFDNFVVPVAIG